jgi:Domain of unknown function (DUF4342)
MFGVRCNRVAAGSNGVCMFGPKRANINPMLLLLPPALERHLLLECQPPGEELYNKKGCQHMSAGNDLPPTTREPLRLTSGQLVADVGQLVDEGNITRIIITRGGHTVAEFPLTVGVLEALLAAPVAALRALEALLNDYTIEVERTVMATMDPVNDQPVETGRAQGHRHAEA